VVVRTLVLLFVCLLAVTVRPAHAQSEARIRIVVPRIDHAEDDLKWLIELSPTVDLKRQWKKLKEDVLDSFTQGFDLTKPLVVDIVFRKDELGYDLQIPVDVFNGKNSLLESIKGIGFNVKEITKESFYEISEKGKKPDYLRYEKPYAWVSRDKSSIPTSLPPINQTIAHLLALKKDVVVELKNDTDGLEGRRNTFGELRKQFESLIKIRRNEDKNVFELRKLALTHQLDEAEPFIVETDQLKASWNTVTEGPNPVGRGEISLTALPGTELHKSIDEFAVKPSRFANIVMHANPIAAGKLNFAVSAPRIKRAQEFYKAVRPAIEGEIDTRAGETPAQKKATKLAMNKFFDMLDAGTELKAVDAFVDSFVAAPGKNCLICGIHAVRGNTAEEILDALKGMKAGWHIKKIEEYAGVNIYELTVPEPRQENFKKFFAGESVLYVGTSKDIVWGAAGADAIKQLKVAIDQVAAPAPSTAEPVFLNYQLQVAKLANLLEAINLDVPVNDGPKTPEEKKKAADAQKKVDRLSKLADDAMKGCEGIIHGELRRSGNTIEGFIEINECALKYIGAVTADQVKELVQ
jgi:hypothetical protein